MALNEESGLRTMQPAKLLKPYRPAVQIQRSRLCDALCHARAPRVSLIRAPAGFGKSTVMQQAYLRLCEEGVPSAWLSLDAADNDAPRLLHFLCKVFEQIASAGDGLSEGLSAGQIALEMLDGLASLPTPCVLFLDDLESLQNPVALALVRQVIEHLPAGARLVFGSRTIPDIGLTRLRTSGQLQELDTARLRFTAQECAQLLRERNQLTLPEPLLQRLVAITEGWPTALWLVSMLMENSSDPAAVVDPFSGSSSLVADYLSEEILARQPAELCDFMLRSSILPQLNAELCDAVLGIDNSRELLFHLEQSNLFLVPLDLERKWFRYHSLFSGFLQEQLAIREPLRVPRLHRTAAHWYWKQQRPVPAIEQALKTGDMAFALPLFTQHAQRLLGEGRSLILMRLIGQVDREALNAQPELQVVHVWATAFTRGAAEAMALLSVYESGSADAPMSLNAMALRPMLLSMLDRHDEACRQAQQDLPCVAPAHVFPHAILRTSLAYVTLVMGNYSEAQSLLDEGRCLDVIDRSPFTNIYAQSVEGVIELMRGQLRQATSRFRLAAGERHGAARLATNGNAMASILLAEVLYEMGEGADCERLLQVYVPLMQQQGVPDHLICGHRNLARLYLARGDVDSALHSINELEYYGQRNGLPRLVACAHLERARLYLLAGDADSSSHELQRAAATANWQTLESWYLFGTDVEYLHLARWRWQIHFDSAAAVLPQLERAIEAAQQQRRIRRSLKLLALKVIALDRAGNNVAALTELQVLMRYACREQSVQLLLDEGEALVALLRQLAAMASRPWDEACLQQPLQLFEQLLTVDPSQQSAAVDAPADLSTLVEKLTKKECSVLRLLAGGLSNNDIGERLFVSESTVRTHLRSINAKLQSKNRTEAVAVARRLGLLS
jgi:LuxR family maltose regulon positive regulatory protein